MGWFGKLTFGTLGLFFGGPLGAIAGAALGHHLVDKKESFTNRAIPEPERPVMGPAEQAQAEFVEVLSLKALQQKNQCEEATNGHRGLDS